MTRSEVSSAHRTTGCSEVLLFGLLLLLPFLRLPLPLFLGLILISLLTSRKVFHPVFLFFLSIHPSFMIKVT